MSLWSYCWDSQEHLSKAAFWVEVLGAGTETIVAIVVVSTFHKEWDEKIKKRLEYLFELAFLIAAVLALVAIISNRRTETLREREMHPPLPERISRILEEIEPKIIQTLKTGHSVTFSGMAKESQKAALDKLLSEPGAARYVQVLSPLHNISISDAGTELSLHLHIGTNLITPP